MDKSTVLSRMIHVTMKEISAYDDQGQNENTPTEMIYLVCALIISLETGIVTRKSTLIFKTRQKAPSVNI